MNYEEAIKLRESKAIELLNHGAVVSYPTKYQPGQLRLLVHSSFRSKSPDNIRFLYDESDGPMYEMRRVTE